MRARGPEQHTRSSRRQAEGLRPGKQTQSHPHVPKVSFAGGRDLREFLNTFSCGKKKVKGNGFQIKIHGLASRGWSINTLKLHAMRVVSFCENDPKFPSALIGFHDPSDVKVHYCKVRSSQAAVSLCLAMENGKPTMFLGQNWNSPGRSSGG